MNTTIVNVKIDSLTKKQAQAVAESLGFSLGSLIKAFIKQLVREKRVSFRVSEEPSDYLIKLMKQAKEDYKKGKASPGFKTGEEAVAWLEKQGI